jgi:hypothetical protein
MSALRRCIVPGAVVLVLVVAGCGSASRLETPSAAAAHAGLDDRRSPA